METKVIIKLYHTANPDLLLPHLYLQSETNLTYHDHLAIFCRVQCAPVYNVQQRFCAPYTQGY